MSCMRTRRAVAPNLRDGRAVRLTMQSCTTNWEHGAGKFNLNVMTNQLKEDEVSREKQQVAMAMVA